MTKIEFKAAIRAMYLTLNAADTEAKADWTKPSDVQASADLDRLISKVFTPEEAEQFYNSL